MVHRREASNAAAVCYPLEMLAFQRWYEDDTPGHRQLFAEGILVSLVGATFAAWLFPQDASYIAVFLTAVASTDSVERLLGWNRREILERGTSPRKANLRMAGRLLMLFAGAVLGFSLLAMLLPLDLVNMLFSKQVAEFGTMAFADLRFGTPGDIAAHNVHVCLFFFMVALPFRQGGIMLAIAWNASVWGSAFALLARQWAEVDHLWIVDAYLRVMAACSPHMALEAAGYVLAGMSGVFLGKALLKHSLESATLEGVLRSVVFMMLLALLLVLLGAAWEGILGGKLVGLVTL
jgi:hypothetical protein